MVNSWVTTGPNFWVTAGINVWVTVNANVCVTGVAVLVTASVNVWVTVVAVITGDRQDRQSVPLSFSILSLSLFSLFCIRTVF